MNNKAIRRKSDQRSRIYTLIKESKIHPTAQWIYDELRKEIPSLSIGNVYRNINILLEEGLLKARDSGDGIIHYDAIIEQHYHFICELCKSIIDLSMPIQEDMMKKAQSLSEHFINSHTIQFYGICKECNQKKQKGVNSRE